MPELVRTEGFAAKSAWGVLGGIVVILAAVVFMLGSYRVESTITIDTPYQAVLLRNGSVYFGQLENYGTEFPVLHDVYYVETAVNQQTKQTSNVLIKRGKELHSPDRMYLNPSQIVLVEPVGANSKVAQLIAESKSKGE